MSEQDKIELFATWLEGNLNTTQQAQFAKLCVEDDEFAERVEQANLAKLLHETTPEYEAPNWSRAHTFEQAPWQHQHAPWWRMNGLSMASFACSLVAVVMVVTGFSIERIDNKLMLSFGHSTKVDSLLQTPAAQAQIDALVEQRLGEYQLSNQTLLADYLQDIVQQQQQTTAQVTEYLLTASRKERREDFAELVKFINQQRRDDQVFYARQLNDLQQELDAQLSYGGSSLMPASNMAINE